MFLQAHFITSYHASLLNRDDAGLAKRIMFGDAERLRVSSQCMKRHWTENLRTDNDLPNGFRTRHFFSREVHRRVLEEGVPKKMADQLTEILIKKLIAKSEKNEGKTKDEKGDGDSATENRFMLKQPALFGKPEADFFVGLLKEAASKGDEKNAKKSLEEKLKTNKNNFLEMLKAAGYGDIYSGLEGALFGRFVTSDILSRTDSCVHVAHPFTVHPLRSEVDFFTVVDDLARDEETGAAHAGDMELGAGVFYGYVVVDIPLMLSNFTGCDRNEWKKQDHQDARNVLHLLIRLIATISPGAKLGSTAPYAHADFVMLESGKAQPRSLANAYLKSLTPKGDIIQEALNALANHLKAIDKMYGPTADKRAIAATISTEAFDDIEVGSLDEIIGITLDAVFGDR